MIRNIIFDFGDVFINLDKTVVNRQLMQVCDPRSLADLIDLNLRLEIGAIGAETFLLGLQDILPGRSKDSLLALWNSMLLDFPEKRLAFLESLAKTGQYQLFLLSNTNEIHIAHVMEKMGAEDYKRFRHSFNGFYLSHEIRLRKPEKSVFEFLLERHRLKVGETLFIDDTLENIETATGLGLHTWHLQGGSDDISEFKSRL
jgi:putative hydrolase of the HAD superfamily